MRNSGIKLIGLIPENWNIIRSKYVCSTYTGDSIKDDEKDLYLDASNSDKYISSKNIDTASGLLLDNDYLYINKNDANFKRAYPKDILMCIEGGSAGRKKTLLNEQVCFVNKLCCFHPFGINERFLYYNLCSPHYENEFNLNLSGMIGGVSRSKLDNFYYLLPDENTQIKISDFLDAKCSQLNALVEIVNKQINNLEEYKKVLIYEAVTKGLNKKSEKVESKVEWLGKIPSNWKLLPNKYVMHKIKSICDHYNGEDVLSLSMNGVCKKDLDNPSGKMPATFDGYQYVTKGNLLMCLFDIDVTPRCIGLINDCGITSPAYSQFVLNDNCLNKYFYYFYLMLDNSKELIHLSKNLRYSITEEQLGLMNVCLPPLAEQIEISNFLDKKCNEIDKLIALKKDKIESILSYKKSLIYEYITGKREVPSNA